MKAITILYFEIHWRDFLFQVKHCISSRVRTRLDYLLLPDLLEAVQESSYIQILKSLSFQYSEILKSVQYSRILQNYFKNYSRI